MESPELRRKNIIERQNKGGFTDFEIKQLSSYQGYTYYRKGLAKACDAHIYAVEQALEILEAITKELEK